LLFSNLSFNSLRAYADGVVCESAHVVRIVRSGLNGGEGGLLGCGYRRLFVRHDAFCGARRQFVLPPRFIHDLFDEECDCAFAFGGVADFGGRGEGA
jgi:hypothetical protein